MLCDEIISDGVPGSGCNIDCLLPAIRAAQKFSLSPDCAAVADELSNDYSGLVRAFEHCRLPFAQTWIELSHADRPQFYSSEMHAPGFQVKPKRVGYLLTATRADLSAWKTHLFWSTDEGCSCAASLAMEFDMTSVCSNDEVLLAEEFKQVIRNSNVLHGMGRNHPGWVHANKDVRLAIMRHTNPVEPDYGPPLPDSVPLDRIREFYEIVSELSCADWAGEPAYLLAVIGLLNARNAIETQTVDKTEFNRKRAKRGRLPLFSHKILRIAMRQQHRVYGADGHQGDYTPMRGHFVRGHFKTRRTGIFFWHPHARGSFKRGTVTKDYEVTA